MWRWMSHQHKSTLKINWRNTSKEPRRRGLSPSYRSPPYRSPPYRSPPYRSPPSMVGKRFVLVYTTQVYYLNCYYYYSRMLLSWCIVSIKTSKSRYKIHYDVCHASYDLVNNSVLDVFWKLAQWCWWRKTVCDRLCIYKQQLQEMHGHRSMNV